VTITRSAVVVSVLIAPAARAAVLDDLATVRDRTSHRASSYDRTGGNTDNVTSFAPGTTVTLLDTDGPGRITHVWLTVSTFAGHATMLRDLVLRMVWDDAPVPSVEAPLGDFFALGHNQPYRIRSIPIAVGDNPLAMNCYWPMPFHRHASVTLTNEATSRRTRPCSTPSSAAIQTSPHNTATTRPARTTTSSSTPRGAASTSAARSSSTPSPAAGGARATR
jgi:hypothetical protein